MEDEVTIFYPNGKFEVGRVVITPTELVFYKKSIVGMSAFGLVGSFLMKGKEHLRIPMQEIVGGRQDRFRANKKACYITLRDGKEWVLVFGKPDQSIPYLASLITCR